MAEDIGLVNIQSILNNSAEAKAIGSALKSEFASRRASIMKMGKNLQAEVQKYQKNQAVLTQKQLANLQQEINKQSMALRQAQAKLQSDFMAARNKKLNAVFNKLKAVVQKVAAKKDLDMVLASNAVLYSKHKIDITPEVLKDMN